MKTNFLHENVIFNILLKIVTFANVHLLPCLMLSYPSTH